MPGRKFLFKSTACSQLAQCDAGFPLMVELQAGGFVADQRQPSLCSAANPFEIN
jgi:hypothetical protein